MTIQIDVSVNGYITIDVPHADAVILGHEAYAKGTDQFANQLAQTIAGHQRVTSMRRVIKKRGLSNRGWYVTYIDTVKKAEYLKSVSEENA